MDVFISYKSEDKEMAKAFAEAFSAEGLGVWWDPVLKTGELYDEVIEANLLEAKTVVVLWSPRSVRSKWVRAEATIGERKGEGGLVPVTIAQCQRPIAFELHQTANFEGWNGDRSEPRWRDFIADVRAALSKRNAATNTASAETQPSAHDIERVFWSSIKDSNDRADFDVYLSRYPHGEYADAARSRLRTLSAPDSAEAPAAPHQTEAAPVAPVPAGGSAATWTWRVAIVVVVVAVAALLSSLEGDAGYLWDLLRNVVIDCTLSAFLLGAFASAVPEPARRRVIFWGTVTLLAAQVVGNFASLYPGLAFLSGVLVLAVAWRATKSRLKLKSEPKPLRPALTLIALAGLGLSAGGLTWVSMIQDSPQYMLVSIALAALFLGAAAMVIARIVETREWMLRVLNILLVVAGLLLIWEDAHTFFPAYVPAVPSFLGGGH